MKRRAVVLGLVLAAAALRVLFFSGGSLYDDVYYLGRALALAGGKAGPPASYFDARIGLVGPAALLARLLGASPLTLVLWPLACSLASVAVAYAVGRRLWDERAGLLAALLVAVAPLELIYATQLYANTPVTLLAGAAFGIFLLAESAWGYLAAGACFGLACVVHEETVMALAFYPPYALLCRRPRLGHLAALAGLVLGLAVDPIAHGLLTGDPLARLHILEARTSIIAGQEYAPGTARWLVEPFVRLFSEQELGLFPWFALPIALWRLRSSSADPSRRALAVIVLAAAAWILYGTTSTASWSGLVREPRYLAPIGLPVAWLLARELDGWRPSRRALALALLVASSLACALVDGGRERLRPYRDAAALLDRAGATEVVADSGSAVPLQLVAPGRAIATWNPDAPPPPGAYVVRRAHGTPPSGRLEHVADIAAPMDLYSRLLSSDLVQRALGVVRGQVRRRSLTNGPRAPVLIVDRVPVR